MKFKEAVELLASSGKLNNATLKVAKLIIAKKGDFNVDDENEALELIQKYKVGGQE